MPDTETKTLGDALNQLQLDPPKITLDGTNPHFKSKYPSLAGVMERVLPATSKLGLVIVQLPTTLDGQPALETRIIHHTGEQMESTMLLLSAKQDPQGQGAALTYARRYMVLSMLGLVGDEDDDANSASKNGERSADGGADGSLSEQSNGAAVSTPEPPSTAQKGKITQLLNKNVAMALHGDLRAQAQTKQEATTLINRLVKVDAGEADVNKLCAAYGITPPSDVPYDESA